MNEEPGDEPLSEVEGSSGKIRVLHVDCSEFVEIASEFLRRNFDGLEVETRTDPEEATAVLREEEFDCVVSDYTMPDMEMDGVDLLSEARSVYPDVPFVFLTDTPQEEMPEEALSRGSTTHLRKKLDEEQFALLSEHVESVAERDT